MSKIGAVFVAILFLGLFAGAIVSPASSMGSISNTILNETWVPNTATATNLVQSNLAGVLYDPYPVVRTNGTSAPNILTVQNIDYKFNNLNGTVQAIPGGALDGLSDASIDYQYSAQNKLTLAFSSIFGGLSSGLLGLMIVIVAMFVLSAFKLVTK
mgnify:CR=1 FL=1|jgi:hypothetical protein|tara:strand:- start:10159 stop:10626 length:468 start_codon:yes stop_codon:yes gene_type:complete